ncbi:hypothetical protein RFM41_14715 [Mesorhizobium sp. VK25A]|uniref:Uncharacterized protein n=1 Tax=Mesorhizobium vachelliae TaxID=3072309 RepID=A0ABU5A986_9HYPH|nr:MULTISPECIES: hypothetical protein [unclassified Mesorhizobium]MDX8533079.1 hypothetical protein [Mesorhizobium sp. VK25D]MDX8544998.1 hypothetical protein [Mesorhizobium sp. VK25A]
MQLAVGVLDFQLPGRFELASQFEQPSRSWFVGNGFKCDSQVLIQR